MQPGTVSVEGIPFRSKTAPNDPIAEKLQYSRRRTLHVDEVFCIPIFFGNIVSMRVDAY